MSQPAGQPEVELPHRLPIATARSAGLRRLLYLPWRTQAAASSGVTGGARSAFGRRGRTGWGVRFARLTIPRSAAGPDMRARPQVRRGRQPSGSECLPVPLAEWPRGAWVVPRWWAVGEAPKLDGAPGWGEPAVTDRVAVARLGPCPATRRLSGPSTPPAAWAQLQL